MPLTCVHHVSWIQPVQGGLHQCILCQQVVRRTDVYPKVDDMPEEFRRRWEEHEKGGNAGAVADGAQPGSPPGAATR